MVKFDVQVILGGEEFSRAGGLDVGVIGKDELLPNSLFSLS
jgi:hypothetical protein